MFSFTPSSSSTSSRNQRRRNNNNKSNYSSGILDRSTIRAGQASSALRLRKQRQEERLASRRQFGRSSSSATTTTTTTDTATLQAALQALLTDNHHHTWEAALHTLQEAAACHHDGNNNNTLTTLLAQCIATDSAKACALMQNLLKQLSLSQQQQQQQQSTTTIDAILSVFICMASPQSSPRTATSTSDDNYYGAAPLTWGDLFLDASNVLMELWFKNIHNANWSALMGILIAQDPTAWCHLLLLFNNNNNNTAWARIVQALPHTMHACAAIVHYDHSTEGYTLMQQLTPERLNQLFQQYQKEETVLVELAWMVEGLTRREAKAVQVLMQHEELWKNITTLLLLAEDETTTTTEVSPRILLPLWRAIGNVAVAQDGQYVTLLLQQYPTLLQAGHQILQSSSSSTTTTTVRVEALATMACLLVDAGRPHHASTTIALPQWLPGLIQTIQFALFDIQVQALHTLVLTLLGPPPTTTPQQQPQQPQDTTTAMMMTPRTEPYTLAQVLQQYVATDTTQLHNVLRVLHDILTRPEAQAQWDALQLLHLLLQNVPAAASSWLEVDPRVHQLEQFLLDHGNTTTEDVANIAADILDDFFGHLNEEEEEEEEEEQLAPPMTSNRAFFTFGGTAPSSPPPQATPPVGRGRGRVMPAWMSKQQS